MFQVTGLSAEQRAACVARGAIVEDRQMKRTTCNGRHRPSGVVPMES